MTVRHDADDFPIVEVDDDGNITDVLKWAEDSVPPLEPYLPWYDDVEDGFIRKRRVKDFVETIRDSPTGAASPEAIEDALLSS